MATANGVFVYLRTSTGFLPALIERAYQANGTYPNYGPNFAPVENAATSNTSVHVADILVLGPSPYHRYKVLKDASAATNGTITPSGSGLATDAAAVPNGRWFVYA
jgi:hypothetical protein